MRMAQLVLLLMMAAAMSACEYAFSDVATRIRYRLLEESASLRTSNNETVTIVLRPDHWPDECHKGEGYRLVLSPYKGGKQVATGDIVVNCREAGPTIPGWVPKASMLYARWRSKRSKKTGCVSPCVKPIPASRLWRSNSARP